MRLAIGGRISDPSGIVLLDITEKSVDVSLTRAALELLWEPSLSISSDSPLDQLDTISKLCELVYKDRGLDP